VNIWPVIPISILLTGCASLKSASIVSASAGVGALAGTVLSGGVLAPTLGAMTSAFVIDAAMNLTTPIGVAMDCAPDNFWSLLGSIIEMGGWALILIFIAPMIMGWLIPGPLEKKKS
jgi:hypothetical protein